MDKTELCICICHVNDDFQNHIGRCCEKMEGTLMPPPDSAQVEECKYCSFGFPEPEVPVDWLPCKKSEGKVEEWEDWRDEILRIAGIELHPAQYGQIITLVESTIQKAVDAAVREDERKRIEEYHEKLPVLCKEWELGVLLNHIAQDAYCVAKETITNKEFHTALDIITKEIKRRIKNPTP